MTLRLPRRRFLQAAGAAALLAACGGDGGPEGGGGQASGATSGAGEGGSVLVALFSTDRVIAAGSRQRIPVGVFSQERTPRREGLPPSTTATITRDGQPVASEAVELHGLDLPFPYYPVRAVLPEPGLYDLQLDLDDGPAAMPVQAFDPAEVLVPQPGQALPGAPTPTVHDPRGVDPICTRFEPCPFHERSLDEVLGTAPVALLVGTPAYCQMGVCGPVLEELIAAAPGHPQLAVVHAEVYANPREVGGNLADPAIRPAPIMAALGLAYEPVLFVVHADGTIADRLDNLYDQRELEATLAALA